MNNNRTGLWVPLADLMTVLMMLFLFLSISFMYALKKKQEKQNKVFKEYQSAKQAIYEELNAELKADFAKWNVKLDKDLSVKFENPQVLFAVGSAEVTPYFQQILADLVPRYLKVLMQQKFRTGIAEIRIEGHTDARPLRINGDPYMDNMSLSQDRARNVLGFIRQQPFFINLEARNQQQLQFWLTANGLSYSRSLDKTGNLIFESHLPADEDRSRRVEFRIVTTAEQIMDETIKSL